MRARQAEPARWSRASRVTKNFTARPTRSRWSGYDASEARSVHRESLWDPKRERAGLAISPRRQSPLTPSLPASCRRPMRSYAPGAGRISRCPRNMPRCTDDAWQSVSSSRQPLRGGLRSARITGLVRSSTQAPASTLRPSPNVCTPCVV